MPLYPIQEESSYRNVDIESGSATVRGPAANDVIRLDVPAAEAESLAHDNALKNDLDELNDILVSDLFQGERVPEFMSKS